MDIQLNIVTKENVFMKNIASITTYNIFPANICHDNSG